jgi:hypothetical protein
MVRQSRTQLRKQIQGEASAEMAARYIEMTQPKYDIRGVDELSRIEYSLAFETLSRRFRVSVSDRRATRLECTFVTFRARDLFLT